MSIGDLEYKYRNTCTCSVCVLRHHTTLSKQRKRDVRTSNHFWLFCFRASSVTERVKIKNPKVLNLVLQNANLLVTEKKYNAGMCDVVFCPTDETAIYHLKRIFISKPVK